MTTARKRRYALLGGLAGAFVLFLVIRGRGRAPAADELLGVPGAAPGQTLDAGGGGSGAGAIDTSFVDLVEQRLAAQETLIGDALARVGDFTGHITELEDFLSTQGIEREGAQWVGPGEIDPDWEPPTAAEPEQGPAGQVPPAAPGNAKAGAGFYWKIAGERTWVTKANVERFVRWLRSKGVDLQKWARQHPDAARAVGLWPPASIPTKYPPGKKPPKKPPEGKKKPPPSRQLSSSGGGLGAVYRAAAPTVRGSLFGNVFSRSAAPAQVARVSSGDVRRLVSPALVTTARAPSFSRGGSANRKPLLLPDG